MQFKKKVPTILSSNEESIASSAKIQDAELLKDQSLKQILLEGGYVQEKDLNISDEDIKNISLFQYLINQNIITKDIAGQAISEYLKIQYADLNSNIPEKDQAIAIPKDIAEKYHAIFYSENDKEVIVASDLPQTILLEKKETIEVLPEKSTGFSNLFHKKDPVVIEKVTCLESLQDLFPEKKITIAYSLPEDIEQVLVYYRNELDTRFSKIIKEDGRVAPEILDEIFSDAIIFSASDIHFEPSLKEVLVRFRIDGVLREAGRIPKEYYENVLNRVKIKSGLRIDEHFGTQDGALRYEFKDRLVDIRVSIAPTVNGEKITLRLLSEYIGGLMLGEIGFSSSQQDILEKNSHKPFGMILTVGPTGSGKTTTLYSIVKTLNTPEVNITTIEDPVEYKIPNINQIQVNKQTNITFSRGLRSIVRQDPDIILVGEVRDSETAEISVNAALTGHLVLSTFHANDAATAIPRLIDMGVEPFLLASTLEIVVGQRLVRKICDSCRVSHIMKKNEVDSLLGIDSSIYFSEKDGVHTYKGKGCSVCNYTGYTGRTAIFELIEIDQEMKELILTKPSSNEVWEVAYKNKASVLFEHGIEKVKQGVTTLEELLRVAQPPKNLK